MIQLGALGLAIVALMLATRSLRNAQAILVEARRTFDEAITARDLGIAARQQASELHADAVALISEHHVQ